MVLDPFCGCATACVSAEQWGRKWIGVDISPRAQTLVVSRLKKTIGKIFTAPIPLTEPPRRTDMGEIKRYHAPENKRHLFGEQQGKCNGCRTEFPYRNFHIHHVIPSSKGGTDHIENLQLLCGNCNSLKGDRAMEYLIVKLKKDGVIK